MIEKGYYTGKKKKLLKRFAKTLKRFENRLTEEYGQDFSKLIMHDATDYFIELIPRIPYYKTAIYRPIILFNAQLIAVVKAMETHGKTVEDVFKIQVGFLRADFQKIPSFAGRIWISKFAGYFLNEMAKKGTKERWISRYVRSSENEDFDVSVITEKCGLVEYLKSEGMTDYLKYCNFNDFLIFPAMNIGLSQKSTIDKGKCVYCMKYKGKTEIPKSLEIIYR